ncbi:hypothetical protein G9A89_020143 [Geosiphon pyriformis]|nr:hypothetical protein G9A89_020143 [Geosiphon pyriformis]
MMLSWHYKAITSKSSSFVSRADLLALMTLNILEKTNLRFKYILDISTGDDIEHFKKIKVFGLPVFAIILFISRSPGVCIKDLYLLVRPNALKDLFISTMQRNNGLFLAAPALTIGVDFEDADDFREAKISKAPSSPLSCTFRKHFFSAKILFVSVVFQEHDQNFISIYAEIEIYSDLLENTQFNPKIKNVFVKLNEKLNSPLRRSFTMRLELLITLSEFHINFDSQFQTYIMAKVKVLNIIFPLILCFPYCKSNKRGNDRKTINKSFTIYCLSERNLRDSHQSETQYVWKIFPFIESFERNSVKFISSNDGWQKVTTSIKHSGRNLWLLKMDKLGPRKLSNFKAD